MKKHRRVKVSDRTGVSFFLRQRKNPAGFVRIRDYIKRHIPFVIMTASKYGVDPQQNFKNNLKLLTMFRAQGIGYIQQEGNDFIPADELTKIMHGFATEEEVEKMIMEPSFFFPYSIKHAKVAVYEFYQLAQYLTLIYDQWGFVWFDGYEAYYVNGQGEKTLLGHHVTPLYHEKPVSVVKKGEGKYFSEVRGHRWRITPKAPVRAGHKSHLPDALLALEERRRKIVGTNPRRSGGKLHLLMEQAGYDDPMQFAKDSMSDSVCMGICMNADCDYTTEVEPDQSHGWCENCNTNTVKSGLMLMGVI